MPRLFSPGDIIRPLNDFDDLVLVTNVSEDGYLEVISEISRLESQSVLAADYQLPLQFWGDEEKRARDLKKTWKHKALW